MQQDARSRRVRLVVVALTVLALDAVSKLAALRWLEDRPVSLGPVDLALRFNTGISFSLGADAPFAVVAAVTGAVVLVLVGAAWSGALHPPTAAGLLVGGGIGNLVDRLLDGQVIDMIGLGWFPTFNLADAALTAGVALVFLSALRPGGRQADQDGQPGRDEERTDAVGR